MSIARHTLKTALAVSAVFSAVFSALLFAPMEAHAANAFDLGKAEFKLKRFHAAKAQFIKAIQQNPSNQKAYLYLGRCLEHLREPEDAQATYRACFSVNPFSEDGKRAKQFSMEVASRMEAGGHRAVDSPDQVIKSGLAIQRQALDLQARKIQEANQYAKNRRMTNKRQGYFYTPQDLTMRRDEVSDMNFIRNAHGIYDVSIDAARARLHGQKLAVSVQDTANALIERLGRKSRSSSPPLRALGTNLYVQYFRSVQEEEDLPPPPDPAIELRARQLKLGESKRKPPASKTFKEPPLASQVLLPGNKTETLDQAIINELTRPRAPNRTNTPHDLSPDTVPAERQIENNDSQRQTPETGTIKEPKPFIWTPR